MNPVPHLTLLGLGCTALFSFGSPDFLRFKNGDTLHGRYLGLDEGPLVMWKSAEAEEPINFETQNLQKLSLNNGRAQSQLSSKGLVELNNGDRIPGEIIAMGSDSVSLQTQFGGLLTIPRNQVVKILPNRHGGNVLYAGPFNDQEWRIPNLDDDEDKTEDDQVTRKGPPAWHYGSAAWYSNSSQVLRLETTLPDRVSIRFQLSWQAPLNANIALFSDFKRPHRELKARVKRAPENKEVDPKEEEENQGAEAEEGEEEAAPPFIDIMEVGTGSSDADRYGSGYLISVLSSYSRLQRLGFDDRLNGKKTSFPNSGGRMNLGDLYKAEFEVRADRLKGTVSLFVNGEFFSEWQDLAEPLGDAERYFAISAGGKSRLRVSDVVISEWNGMPDSARSMQTSERDVLLLANGTDRFSGEILTMEEDVFRVKSDYGVFEIPADEVTDIQLATDSVLVAPDAEEGEILVSFQPNGLLTVVPKEGQSADLQCSHAILGELSLDLNYAYLLEFDPIGTIFDNWDDEF